MPCTQRNKAFNLIKKISKAFTCAIQKSKYSCVIRKLYNFLKITFTSTIINIGNKQKYQSLKNSRKEKLTCHNILAWFKTSSSRWFCLFIKTLSQKGQKKQVYTDNVLQALPFLARHCSELEVGHLCIGSPARLCLCLYPGWLQFSRLGKSLEFDFQAKSQEIVFNLVATLG